MSNRVFVSLGSNIDKEKNLPEAVRLLSELCRVITVSSVYETPPVGGADEMADREDFLNAAVLVETELNATQFKHQVLAQVERRLGRVRTSDRNAPRTIDADMTLFNRDVFDIDSAHHIPDPELLHLGHIAIPIAELAPDLVHPETGERMADIAARLSHDAGRNNLPQPWKKPELDLNALLDP